MDNQISAVNVDSLILELEVEPDNLPEHYSSLNAYQWAEIMEGLTSEQRLRVWPHLQPEQTGSILSAMREDTRNQLISVLPQASIVQAIETGTNTEAVEILDVLSRRQAKRLVNKLAPDIQGNLETSLSYSDDEVGRYANPNAFTVDGAAKVSEVLIEIKSNDIVNATGVFIVLDGNQNYLGEISINELLNAQKSQQVQSLAMKPELTILDTQSLLETSNLVRGSKRTNLPVLTGAGKFIGQFSVQDALDVFQKHYEAQVAHLGKVNDEDLFAPVWISAGRRAVWLGINLVTAFLAAAVIGLFDKVLVEVVALAVLMPIVASMGGITGSQTLTLTIRGIATGALAESNYKALRNKELSVACINGILWALIVAAVSMYWFDNQVLSVILAVAIVINMAVASVSGILIPKILTKIGIDPALAGSVILTTVTDVVGFFVFLGSATVLFLN